MMKYPLRSHILSALGTGTILVLSLVVTYQIYTHGVQKDVYTNNYTTNILLSDSLSKTTGAAPLLMVSVLWFACRASIKKWRKFIAKRFY